MSDEERQHLENLLKQYRANLRHLEYQESQHSPLDVPLHLHNAITIERQRIVDVENRLQTAGNPSEKPIIQAVDKIPAPNIETSPKVSVDQEERLGLETSISNTPPIIENQPASPRPLRVFLSYSSVDIDDVRKLYQDLVNSNLDVWFDEQKLLGGQRWKREIEKSIRDTDVVIVCLSNKSVVRKGYIQEELDHALEVASQQPEGTIFIIPLKLDECKVPERLKELHWENLFKPGSYERLLRALQVRAAELGVLLPDSRGKNNSETFFSRMPDLEQKDVPFNLFSLFDTQSIQYREKVISWIKDLLGADWWQGVAALVSILALIVTIIPLVSPYPLENIINYDSSTPTPSPIFIEAINPVSTRYPLLLPIQSKARTSFNSTPTLNTNTPLPNNSTAYPAPPLSETPFVYPAPQQK